VDDVLDDCELSELEEDEREVEDIVSVVELRSVELVDDNSDDEAVDDGKFEDVRVVDCERGGMFELADVEAGEDLDD
jgi:hypothetical protein